MIIYANGYSKFMERQRKTYYARVVCDGVLRVLHKHHSTASEALAYQQRVIIRCMRLDAKAVRA